MSKKDISVNDLSTVLIKSKDLIKIMKDFNDKYSSEEVQKAIALDKDFDINEVVIALVLDNFKVSYPDTVCRIFGRKVDLDLTGDRVW